MPVSEHLSPTPRTPVFGLPKNRVLFTASLMIFFWALFDGVISYITPILIQNHGYSDTVLGLIIATSSLAGAIFDFIISKLFKSTHYLRLFLILLFICLLYPFLLWSANSVVLFIFCMAIWGFYYDIFNFGEFDLVSQTSAKSEHCQNSGIVIIFKSLGYLIAPIIAAYLIVDQKITASPFLFAFFFVIIALVFYLILTGFSSSYRENNDISVPAKKSVGWQKELSLWKNVGSILFPVLVFNTMLYIFDATFWTIGPIFSASFREFRGFGGLFMTAYTLPTLLTGWFVENITRKYGKKRTAYFSFLLCSLTLILIGFLKNPYLILVTVLVASFLGSIAWPAIKGAYVDYITESKIYQNEIEGLNDFTTNIGYVIGPMFAGFAADILGIGMTFTFLGIFNVFLIILLFCFTPKHIRVALRKSLS